MFFDATLGITATLRRVFICGHLLGELQQTTCIDEQPKEDRAKRKQVCPRVPRKYWMVPGICSKIIATIVGEVEVGSGAIIPRKRRLIDVRVDIAIPDRRHCNECKILARGRVGARW